MTAEPTPTEKLNTFVAEHPYKENILVESPDKVVELLIEYWNQIVLEIENKTILFALQVKKLCAGYPEKTVSEIIEKVRNHPDLLQPAHSKDRIMQGVRLVQERPDLIDSPGDAYKKKDGSTFWEFYFILYKYRMPGFHKELEQKGKANNWSVRKLKSEIGKLMEEKRVPHTKTRHEKHGLIRELVIMLRCLEVQDLKMLRSVIQEQFNKKLDGWKLWMKKRYEE